MLHAHFVATTKLRHSARIDVHMIAVRNDVVHMKGGPVTKVRKILAHRGRGAWPDWRFVRP